MLMKFNTPNTVYKTWETTQVIQKYSLSTDEIQREMHFKRPEKSL